MEIFRNLAHNCQGILLIKTPKAEKDPFRILMPAVEAFEILKGP
jgi:hypothetical protein